MNNIKFTGANIAAAVLILTFFMPWIGMMGISMSGFSVMSNGVSPGIWAVTIDGLSRLFMVLAIVIPASAGIILYQNITGNTKFSKYYKPAHLLPAVYLVVGIIGLYFKMKPDIQVTAAQQSLSFLPNEARQAMNAMTPGAFDVINIGVYVALAASIYLLLVSLGKVKDKEYYKAKAAVPEAKPLPDSE